jgi:hypothetical protein
MSNRQPTADELDALLDAFLDIDVMVTIALGRLPTYTKGEIIGRYLVWLKGEKKC